MRYNHINTALPPDHRPQPSNDAAHLTLGMLIGPAIVPAGALQAQKIQTSDPLYPGVQIDSPLRPFVFVSDIVVSADKIKWRAE